MTKEIIIKGKNVVSDSTVEAAERAIEFCARYGMEVIFLLENGEVIQYSIFEDKML